MSSTEAAPEFVRAEESRHTMTVYYRTEAGEHATTFSRHDEPEGYALKTHSVSNMRRSDKKQEVELYLAIDGAEGTKLFSIYDAQGNVTKEGVFVSHSLKLALPNENATRLSHQLSNFNTPADELARSLRVRTETVVSITYAEDHITVNYGYYGALKLGLQPGHYRFALKSCGRMRERHESVLPRLYFVFTDETGEEQFVPFNARDSKIDTLEAELKKFIEARAHLKYQEVNG